MQKALDALFAGKDPVARETCESLIRAVGRLGKFDCEFKKTCLHLSHGTAFAGVHPRKSGVLLTIRTDAPIKSARVRKSEQVSRNRCHNDVLVSGPKEVDAELMGWLRKAYEMSVAAK